VGSPRRTCTVDPLEGPAAQVVLKGVSGTAGAPGAVDEGSGSPRQGCLTASAVQVPDYFEAVLGWRVWDVVERNGALCLSSPGFPILWLPRQETIARCNRSTSRVASRSLRADAAPYKRCSCGIYATQTAAQSVPYLTHLFPRRNGVLQRLMGRVSLWGTVVECRSGWRASNAYPARLYLPAPSPGWLSFLGGLPHSARTAEEIAAELAEYRVPVELVDVATPSGLVAMLDRTSCVRPQMGTGRCRDLPLASITPGPSSKIPVNPRGASVRATDNSRASSRP
jgi:hypothetical protein